MQERSKDCDEVPYSQNNIKNEGKENYLPLDMNSIVSLHESKKHVNNESKKITSDSSLSKSSSSTLQKQDHNFEQINIPHERVKIKNERIVKEISINLHEDKHPTCNFNENKIVIGPNEKKGVVDILKGEDKQTKKIHLDAANRSQINIDGIIIPKIENKDSEIVNQTENSRNKAIETDPESVKDTNTCSLSNIQKLSSGEKRDSSEALVPLLQHLPKKLKELEKTKCHPKETCLDKHIQDKESTVYSAISEVDIDKIDSGSKHQVTDSEIPKSISMSVDNSSSSFKHSGLPPNNLTGTEISYDQNFASLVNLDKIPDVGSLSVLAPLEVVELEMALQIGEKFNCLEDNWWRDDWSGNLQLIEKTLVTNIDTTSQSTNVKPITLPFFVWVAKKSKKSGELKEIHMLFSFVYHMKGTPLMAKKIMAYSIKRPVQSMDERLKFIIDAVRRISYDPIVLNQDGWTTKKADCPDGTFGGAYLIGRRVFWHRYEAIVIAYVRDDEIGDLWKAMWLEDNETFDLEAGELQEALKKWEKKNLLRQKQALTSRSVKSRNHGNKVTVKPMGSLRFETTRNFSVEGIEHGIILATSYNARNSVPWPARVMHTSEIKALGHQTSRRSSSRNEIQIVFLAPYWNGQNSQSSRNKGISNNVKAENSGDKFSTGNLFEFETIDVSDNTIKKYPYDDFDDTMSVDKIRAAFSFLCLPKAAFSRFLDSHRLALAFKFFAKRDLGRHSNSSQSNSNRAGAFASLTDCHPLQVETYLFPSVILNLPYEYLLSQLPHPNEQISQMVSYGEEMTEPILRLHIMLKAMAPPLCWGKTLGDDNKNIHFSPTDSTMHITPQSMCQLTPIKSPDFVSSTNDELVSSDNISDWSLSNFTSEYLINLIGGSTGNQDTKCMVLRSLGKELRDLLSHFQHDTQKLNNSNDINQKKKILKRLLLFCLSLKGHGENLLISSNIPSDLNVRNLSIEWKKACERLFKKGTTLFSSPGYGNGVTRVITDSRCNQHLTAAGSYERSIRVPAAVRGAKMTGAGSDDNFPLITIVDERFIELTEKKILPMAHKQTYLNRIKAKIAALPIETRGAPLTDDSEGEGGEDTLGSRGSYTAAVAAVAAAIQGVEMIISGHCVNSFCAVRPPGHHAGKELHAMNAISNGFCLLNAAACAALYATKAQSDGGLGLKKVCVIDFDVHHGNGTQDILCSTYDPRFLYVSTHAGGAHINGYDDEDSHGAYRHSHGYSRCDGIYPGRCGDTSPHDGVLNIPLGSKVTSQALGIALVSRVAPAVEAFSPDLIIISAGFDAHKNDPLGMGDLTAEDFGSVTSVICHMALKSCSGRVLSILEGGYGVPCCHPKTDLFLPKNLASTQSDEFSLKEDLPKNMEDIVDPALSQKLERCKQEGFMECVKAHVGSLSKYNNRSK